MAKRIPIKIRSKSGFDKSFQNIFTSKPGTIVPVLVDELMPKATVHLRAALQASLPPLAFDTFMRCSIQLQAFFVPHRLIVGSYEDFFTGQNRVEGASTFNPAMPYAYLTYTDYANFIANQNDAYFKSGTLADFLGIRGLDFGGGQSPSFYDFKFSLMPFLAYHKIYNDWFRNTLFQKEVFTHNAVSAYTNRNLKCCSEIYFNTNTAAFTLVPAAPISQASSFLLADNHNLFDLRQANFPDDLFTLGQPSGSQAAAPVVVQNNQFTIPAVRMANAMQRYAEIKQIAGPRYLDELRAQYGATLSSGVAQRALYLGSTEFEVYSKGIYQTNESTAQNNNPFTSTGARFGDALASGSDGLIDTFEAEEPGYLFVMAELIPRVTYSTGMAPHMLRYVNGLSSDIGDLANPIFEGIGNEALPSQLLSPVRLSTYPQIFAYAERFAQWKTRVDELHGLVRDGESLSSMVLQRSFAPNGNAMNGAWLQIPTNYLDQVTAVTAEVSQYGYWCDIFFKYTCSMPLKPYALPCLEEVDEEHQTTVSIPMSGSRV